MLVGVPAGRWRSWLPAPCVRPPLPDGRPRGGPRRGSSRSRCSGTGCRRAPRGCPRRTARGCAPAVSSAATSRPGVQKPHWTAPASMNACWIGESSVPSPVCESVPWAPTAVALRRASVPQAPVAQPPCSARCLAKSARPSTVTTSRPSTWPAATRQEHTGTPSRRTVQEPHSPCSQAFLEPGRPRRSRSTYSRDSPSHTSSASCGRPLTVKFTRITRAPSVRAAGAAVRLPGPAERAAGHDADRVAAVARGAAHVVDRVAGAGAQLGELLGDRRGDDLAAVPEAALFERGVQELLGGLRPDGGGRGGADAGPHACGSRGAGRGRRRRPR